jgi:DNA-binding NtrC family response regulator
MKFLNMELSMTLPPRVLYIDNEADLLELATSFFDEENLPIHTSTNIQGALKMMRVHDYELIITDIRMPQGSGFELLTVLRSNGFRGKVILVTGHIESIEAEDQKLCDLVLLKPMRFQELVDNVKLLLK